MDFSVRFQDDIVVIMIYGDFIAGKLAKLDEKIAELIKEKKTNIIIDFSEVEFIDSSGIGFLIKVLKKISEIEKGKLKLASLKLKIANIFKHMKLYSIFEIYDNLEEALESFE